MVQQGQRDGAAVVPLGWVEDIGANGDREAWRTGEFGERFAPLSRSMSYRSGWYVVDGPPRMLFATGIHGQNLFVDEASRLVVAKVSSQGRPGGRAGDGAHPHGGGGDPAVPDGVADGKRSFLERKNQRTFTRKRTKVFCFFFSKKKRLPLPCHATLARRGRVQPGRTKWHV